MNTVFEQLGGRYVQHGDYLIPDLTLDTVREGVHQGMSSIQLMAPASAVQPEVKADDNDPAQENYDIAEAFLKDLGL